jgi:hypothetical protein
VGFSESNYWRIKALDNVGTHPPELRAATTTAATATTKPDWMVLPAHAYTVLYTFSGSLSTAEFRTNQFALLIKTIGFQEDVGACQPLKTESSSLSLAPRFDRLRDGNCLSRNFRVKRIRVEISPVRPTDGP